MAAVVGVGQGARSPGPLQQRHRIPPPNDVTMQQNTRDTPSSSPAADLCYLTITPECSANYLYDDGIHQTENEVAALSLY